MSRSSFSFEYLLKKAFLCLGALILVGLIVVIDVDEVAVVHSEGKPLEVKLSRGSLTILDFPSKKPETTAILLFGSGDGGWSTFEEAICRAFQNQGYEVIGIDSNAYARTDYNLDILQADFRQIALKAVAPFGSHPPPLIVGGYSMGAAQAIAVAGGPHPPEGLTGLLLVAPCSRGRYGLRSSDQLDMLPTGPGTFGVNEFAHSLDHLRVVQWHASNDGIDSTSWLDSLTAPHKSYIFPNTGHHFNVNRDDFIRQFLDSAGWILKPEESTVAAKTAMAP